MDEVKVKYNVLLSKEADMEPFHIQPSIIVFSNQDWITLMHCDLVFDPSNKYSVSICYVNESVCWSLYNIAIKWVLFHCWLKHGIISPYSQNVKLLHKNGRTVRYAIWIKEPSSYIK